MGKVNGVANYVDPQLTPSYIFFQREAVIATNVLR